MLIKPILSAAIGLFFVGILFSSNNALAANECGIESYRSQCGLHALSQSAFWERWRIARDERLSPAEKEAKLARVNSDFTNEMSENIRAIEAGQIRFASCGYGDLEVAFEFQDQMSRAKKAEVVRLYSCLRDAEDAALRLRRAKFGGF